jgi:hypothetical protein
MGGKGLRRIPACRGRGGEILSYALLGSCLLEGCATESWTYQTRMAR